MFGFGKETAPPLCKSNPGICVEGKVALERGDRSWTEQFNTVTLAASALQARGFAVCTEKTWLVHEDSGFILLPQLVQLEPLEDGGVRTVTTMQTNDLDLAPDGLFEYQHSTGDSVADSICKGFDQWAQGDFPPLVDALRPKPQVCTMLELAFPAKDGAPARARRAMLGPIAHYMASPAAANNDASTCTVDALGQEGAGDAHPFCPCCLLTRSFEAFRELIEGDGFYGVRLYAMRDAEGAPQADCRVNGDDWEKGAQALRDYVRTWPEAGFEFRKQYVVLHSVAKGLSPA